LGFHINKSNKLYMLHMFTFSSRGVIHTKLKLLIFSESPPFYELIYNVLKGDKFAFFVRVTTILANETLYITHQQTE